MGTGKLQIPDRFDWGIGFGAAAITAAVFCSVLVSNNNALNPYSIFYGPAAIVLNYQIQWNNVFPQTLLETGNYAGLLKTLFLIAMLWTAYWGSIFGFLISFFRKKKFRAIFWLIFVVAGVNCFSAMFQRWFIGMRIIM